MADTSDLSRDAIRQLVDLCLENCRASEPEADVALYEGKAPDTPETCVFDADTAGMGHTEREERCRLMHDQASRADNRVVFVRETSWSDGSESTFYASSEGFLGWYDETWASCAVTVVLSDGEAQEMSGAYAESRRASDIDPGSVAREAVERGALTLGGKPAPTGVYDVVLDPEAAASLVEAVGELFPVSYTHLPGPAEERRLRDPPGSVLYHPGRRLDRSPHAPPRRPVRGGGPDLDPPVPFIKGCYIQMCIRDRSWGPSARTAGRGTPSWSRSWPPWVWR